MGRPREFNERTVLNAAQKAFRSHGYAGTPLRDLMSATGLGKGSLYAAFGDKRGLYLRTLYDYAQRSVASVGDALDRPRAIEALREHLLAIARSSTEGPSCLLASSTAELGGVDADVGQCIEETFCKLGRSYAGAIARAQAEGDIDAYADPEALGGLLLTVARGLEALGHAGTPEASLAQTVGVAMAGLPAGSLEVMSAKLPAKPDVATASPDSPRRRLKRAKQQRSLDTQTRILNAAISEFAEKGFDAASIRSIADRISMQHPLITYHYGNKDALWRAAAKYVFDCIRAQWDESMLQQASLSPLERLRLEYETLFRYTASFPEFHRFMRQEAQTDTPRLRWVAEVVISPLLDRILPQIEEAQLAGLLPKVEPLLFHYLMVSLTATLSDFGHEIEVIKGTTVEDPDVIDSYWKLVDEMVFVRRGLAKPRLGSKGAPDAFMSVILE